MNPGVTAFNPFDYLGAGAAKIVAEAWTTVMVALWSSGLWFLRLVLTVADYLTVPDLSADGPAGAVYQVMAWIGLSLLIVLTLAQLGVSVFRRDGKSLAQVVIGVGQFIVIWASFITYAVALLVAVRGLTKALMQVMLGIGAWDQWDPVGDIVWEDITDGTLATVLGVMGFFLWIGGVVYFLVMLARSVALLVLAATTPVTAAGLSSEVGKPWFWKCVRWFHAAAFTPLIMVMCLGIGVMVTHGIIVVDVEDFGSVVGSAIPSVILICVATFSPLILFKLLAFVDPGTSSGAAMRAGLASSGGIQGLLRNSSDSSSTSTAASTTDTMGKSSAEKSAESDVGERASKGVGSLLGGAGAMLGPVGGAVTAGLGLGLSAMTVVGTKGAVIGADLTNQMGVGAGTYIPEVGGRGHTDDGSGGQPTEGADTDQDHGQPTRPAKQPDDPQQPDPTPVAQPSPPSPPEPGQPGPSDAPGTSPPTDGSGPASTGAGAGANNAAAGSGGAAAAPPPV